ncbi:hypothetical protein CMV30_16845 [Nibricoccus aquaticus]|uniref:Uncharacterized protein n=1 Tax=Nibricoccus aquaticus TaxID=2576891 RepID=A0A290QB52_9BACT|nr:hypothetical protein CMV30_16845 [Nibricoccus aquaticus]
MPEELRAEGQAGRKFTAESAEDAETGKLKRRNFWTGLTGLRGLGRRRRSRVKGAVDAKAGNLTAEIAEIAEGCEVG